MAANAPPAASRNAWLSVGAPILGLVLLVSLFALLLLLSFARQQDKDYANGSRQLVSSALDGRAHAIASLTIDYANWDDAYQNISRRFSRRWLERVFYSSVTDAFVVFQRGHAPRFVWFKDEASPGLGAAIARTASKAPNLDSLAGALEPPDGVATAYAVVGGRLAVIGIAPVTPENNERHKILMSNTGYASDLVDTKKYPYHVLIGPTYSDQFDMLFKYIKSKQGSGPAPKVALVYTATEFDIGRILAFPGEALELGRSCVAAARCPIRTGCSTDCCSMPPRARRRSSRRARRSMPMARRRAARWRSSMRHWCGTRTTSSCT